MLRLAHEVTVGEETKSRLEELNSVVAANAADDVMWWRSKGYWELDEDIVTRLEEIGGLCGTGDHSQAIDQLVTLGAYNGAPPLRHCLAMSLYEKSVTLFNKMASSSRDLDYEECAECWQYALLAVECYPDGIAALTWATQCAHYANQAGIERVSTHSLRVHLGLPPPQSDCPFCGTNAELNVLGQCDGCQQPLKRFRIAIRVLIGASLVSMVGLVCSLVRLPVAFTLHFLSLMGGVVAFSLAIAVPRKLPRAFTLIGLSLLSVVLGIEIC